MTQLQRCYKTGLCTNLLQLRHKVFQKLLTRDVLVSLFSTLRKHLFTCHQGFVTTPLFLILWMEKTSEWYRRETHRLCVGIIRGKVKNAEETAQLAACHIQYIRNVEIKWTEWVDLVKNHWLSAILYMCWVRSKRSILHSTNTKSISCLVINVLRNTYMCPF